MKFVPLVWRVPLLYVVAFFIAIGQGLSYPSLTSLVTKASPPNAHGSSPVNILASASPTLPPSLPPPSRRQSSPEQAFPACTTV